MPISKTDEQARSREVMEIARDVREWAKEERARNHRIAGALEEFAAALEQKAKQPSIAGIAKARGESRPGRRT